MPDMQCQPVRARTGQSLVLKYTAGGWALPCINRQRYFNRPC